MTRISATKLGPRLQPYALVSAFAPAPSAVQALLAQLATAGFIAQGAWSLAELASGDRGEDLPLLVLLPVRGDDDLLPQHHDQLRAMARHPSLAHRRLLFVLHGDRHVWDRPDPDSPIQAKLQALFYFAQTMQLCPEKLDSDAADWVARYAAQVLASPPPAEARPLGSISRLLQQRPRWQPAQRNLGFYDARTGASLLSGQPPAIRQAVLEIVQNMPLRGLEINHAQLTSAQLAGHSSQATHVDLIGNGLDGEAAWSAFPAAHWLNLAANDLTAVDASDCPPTLTQLYLHKNAIERLQLPAERATALSSLSLYRNRLPALAWPARTARLTKLNLGANPLTALPPSLQHARELRFLGLARTSIDSLPGWLLEMPQLEELDLSHIHHRIPAQQLAVLTARGVRLLREPGKIEHDIRV